MKREWAETIFFIAMCAVLLAAMGWMIWFMNELIWAIRCALG